jgi:hypothetical protein
MQLAAAIAPDGNQRDVADLPETVVDPQALQQLVDKFGARFNELLGRNAASNALPSQRWKTSICALICAQVSSCCGQTPGLSGWSGRVGSAVLAYCSGKRLLIARHP